MAGVASVGGLISGIDVETIIQKLSDVSRQQITQYQSQQSTLRARQKAYQEANTRLLAVQDAASKLSSASFFNARSAASTSPSVAVTAQSGATPGEYQLTIGALAQAHQVVSQSYADVDTTRMGAGTLSITAGGQATVVTVDESNNTLSGIRDAINAAGSTVRASIIQDGDSSYRLLIASKETGLANALTVDAALAGGAAPVFADLQAARDAQVTLGSGAGAITVTRSANTIRDLIPGTTLNLLSGAAGSSVTIDVSLGADAIQQGVQDFVDQYNNLIRFLNQQFKFDPDTNQSGVLLGDFTLQGIQSEVLGVLSGAIEGVSGSANSLADLGIATEGDGTLAFATETFAAQLQADPEGVARVFALTGRTTNAGVRFLGAGDRTAAEGSAYAVEIVQAARQARVTAGVAQTGALAADETLAVNGVAVALTAGMTQTQVLAAINAHSSETGVLARATGADGAGTGSYLSLFSVAYGAAASVQVVSTLSSAVPGSAGVGDVLATDASPAGESGAGTGAAGLDVAGTINGEAATGNGQVLTGDEGNATTDGLRLRITGTSTGAQGTVQVFGGAAHAATRSLRQITDTVRGPIQTERDALDTRIADLQSIIDTREGAAQRQEIALRARFNSMEALLGQLQSQASFLTAQLSGANSGK